MAPKACRSCGGLDGAHYAFCFGARLFERVMGKGFPLFPPGAFTRPTVLEAVQRVVERDGTVSEAQRAAREAGGALDFRLEPDPSAEAFREIEEQARLIEELRDTLHHERDEALAQRLALIRERDELRSLVDAATAPDTAESADAAEEFTPEPSSGEPEPWWWSTPMGREARASTALDRETQVVGESYVVDATVTLGDAEVSLRDPMPTLEQLAEAPDEPAGPDVPADGMDEAEVEALEEAAAELGAVQDPAEIEEVETSLRAATERRERMDAQRARLRELITTTNGLTQATLSQAVGVNAGTVSSILNGKVYGPVSAQQLERMVQAAENWAPTPPAPAEEETRPGGLAAVKRSAGWSAVELFLEEATVREEGAFTSAPEAQAAYEEFRQQHDLPPVKPVTLGQVIINAGFERLRRHSGTSQVRGYGGMRLKTLVSAGARERQGGGDEAPQDSDGEPVASAPATPERERLHPDAQRYTHDDVPELIDSLHQQGRSVKGVLSTFLAAERSLSTVSGTAGDPAAYMSRTAPEVPVVVVDHPLGWDDMPGKELKNTEVRAMALILRKDQGWGYRRPSGRNAKPRLRSPEGRVFVLSATPEDWRSAKNTRAQLRRIGANL